MAVKTTTRLHPEDLQAFRKGDILALVVKDFYDKNNTAAVNKLAHHPDLEEYQYVTTKNGKTTTLPFGVKRLGEPFSRSFGKTPDSPERQKYYLEAAKGMRRLREIFTPNLSPIDKLRIEMDETWPGGAGIARLEGKLMFTGIIRITEPDIAILEKKPHVDSMTPDIQIDRQFAANIFLETPEEGGELVIYPHYPMLTQAQVHDITVNENLWSDSIGASIAIKPEAGDLILIHTQIPHAVKRFSEGRRISVQTFFAVDDSNKLIFWC